MENHTYKHCLLNDFNLLILYYMCYWNFCDNLIFRASAKTPLFTSSSCPIKLLLSQKEKLRPERMDCKVKNATFSRITFPSQKCFRWEKPFFGESFFFSGKYYHLKNLKRKIFTFPQQFFSNKVPFFLFCVSSMYQLQ